MIRRSNVWLIVLSGVAIVLIARTMLVAAPASAPPTDEVVKSFGDGYLLLYMERTTGIEGQNQTEVIEQAELIKIGERYFIRGRGTVAPPYENDPQWSWFKGVPVAYDWKSVVQFSLLTPEQLKGYHESLSIEE